MECKNRLGKVHCKNSERSLGEYKQVPWLNLSGFWLQKAGFEIGDNIAITVNEETLTIKVSSKAPKPKSIWED